MPLEHLAEYTDRLTRVFEKHGTARHVVRARLGRHACTCARCSTCRRDGARRCAPSPRRPARSCASTRARILGRARRRARALGMDRAVLRPAAHARAGRDQVLFDPEGPDEPRQDRAAAEDGRPLALPLQARLRDVAPGRPRSTGRSGASRARRARGSPARSRCATTTATAASSTPARCARPTARPATSAPHARPREHAAPRAVGPARTGCARRPTPSTRRSISASRCKGCKRECPTGVDMARMKIEFLHHYHGRRGLALQGPAGRVPAALRADGRPRGAARESARPRAAARAG